jgi:hypothetical protein
MQIAWVALNTSIFYIAFFVPTVTKVNCQNSGCNSSEMPTTRKDNLYQCLGVIWQCAGVKREDFGSTGVLEKRPHVRFAVSDTFGFISWRWVTAIDNAVSKVPTNFLGDQKGISGEKVLLLPSLHVTVFLNLPIAGAYYTLRIFAILSERHSCYLSFLIHAIRRKYSYSGSLF